MHAVEQPLSPPAPLPTPVDPLTQLDTLVRTMARERPVALVAGALVVGFVIGKLAARL